MAALGQDAPRPAFDGDLPVRVDILRHGERFALVLRNLGKTPVSGILRLPDALPLCSLRNPLTGVVLNSLDGGPRYEAAIAAADVDLYL